MRSSDGKRNPNLYTEQMCRRETGCLCEDLCDQDSTCVAAEE